MGMTWPGLACSGTAAAGRGQWAAGPAAGGRAWLRVPKLRGMKPRGGRDWRLTADGCPTASATTASDPGSAGSAGCGLRSALSARDLAGRFPSLALRKGRQREAPPAARAASLRLPFLSSLLFTSLLFSSLLSPHGYLRASRLSSRFALLSCKSCNLCPFLGERKKNRDSNASIFTHDLECGPFGQKPRFTGR